MKKNGGCFWFSVFSFPQYFCCFFLPWIVMVTLSVNHFQSNLFNILYDIRLSSTFLWTFFSNVIFCVCSLLFFFSLNPMSILPELLDTSTVQLLTKIKILLITLRHINVLHEDITYIQCYMAKWSYIIRNIKTYQQFSLWTMTTSYKLLQDRKSVV